MSGSARLVAGLCISLSLLAGTACAGEPISFSAKAEALIARGEYEKALDELKSGVSLFPYDETMRHDLAGGYLQIGQRDMKLNQYRRAADYFGQAKELYPGNQRFIMLRGVALYLGKDYDAARAELLQAGDGPEPLFFLGKIAYDTGDLPGALAKWRRALELQPGNEAIGSQIAKAERELPVEAKMDKRYSSMFDITYDAELPPGLAAEVLDALESAYNSVGADLGLFPANRIPVLLYTKSDYSSVTAGPDWSGGLYDGKIRLPVGGIAKITPQMRGILLHEFTHVLIAEMTRGNIPTWLNEGLAEVEGRKEFNPPATLVARAAQDGTLLAADTLSGSFGSMGGPEARLAYQQSYSIANFMVTRYGWYAIQAILKHLGERDSIEIAVAKGLSDWSLDLPGVMREWRQSL